MSKEKELLLPVGVSRDGVFERLDRMKQFMAYYECAMMEVETKFEVLNKQFSVQHSYNPIEAIKTRLKTPESIYSKLERRGLAITQETLEQEIHDIAGVRVICPFIHDIYEISDCFLAQESIRVLERKDYIKTPKDNGYRSLHLIVETPIYLTEEKKMVKVEIQFRTIAMDFWASLEHRIRYKKEMAPDILAEISDDLKVCAETSARLDIMMEKVKNKINTFAEEK